MELKEKKVLVFGSGISGEAAAVLLDREGAHVILYDGNEKLDAAKIKEKMPENVEVVVGAFPEEILDELDLTVMSPGVPTDLPVVEERKRNSGLGRDRACLYVRKRRCPRYYRNERKDNDDIASRRDYEKLERERLCSWKYRKSVYKHCEGYERGFCHRRGDEQFPA